MNKKIPLGIVIGLICISVTISSAITMSVINRQYNNILKGLPEKIERYELVDELDNIIKNNYYSQNKADFQSAIANGYVENLGDNYSQLLSPEEYAQYLSSTQGDMTGIGIEYTKTSGNYIKVTEVYDDSPAKTAGLRSGDLIVAFDGIMLDVNNYAEMSQKLEGDKLTSVNITYRRNKTDTTVNIVKGYEAKSVQSQAYGNVGYIRISNFYPSTSEQVSQIVDRFISSGIAALVLDLRKNQSENFDTAMDCLDVFVPVNDSDIPAATIVDAGGNVIKRYSTTAGEIGLPMAVLISEKTKAAAELFAAEMRDFSKAQLVGKTTAGVGLKRDAFLLSNGSAVLLSVGEIHSYRSGSFLSTGVSPDVESEPADKSVPIETDPQFMAAVSLISPSVQ